MLQCRLEFGYPGRSDVTGFVENHPDVIVNQDVTHAADAFPIEVTTNGLAGHLNIADDCVLQLLRRHKLFFAGPDEAGSAVAALRMW